MEQEKENRYNEGKTFHQGSGYINYQIYLTTPSEGDEEREIILTFTTRGTTSNIFVTATAATWLRDHLNEVITIMEQHPIQKKEETADVRPL